MEYEQIPKYCSLCKHVGHQDFDCYSKGNAAKPPPSKCNNIRNQSANEFGQENNDPRGKNVAEPKALLVFDRMPVRVLHSVYTEKGACSKTAVAQQQSNCSETSESHQNTSEQSRDEMDLVIPTPLTSSLEDCVVRGKHKQSQSLDENFQPNSAFNFDIPKINTEFRILTSNRLKQLVAPTPPQFL
ncbi:hypothetical protein Salat_2554400 [Sesamum alatum]|uniref:Uncharacterized protein n=1 Tax=Sesamum alatum TaxID=300844 RepID=A0AAE2CCN0_9LAMI|nr:hypothetical protein Salat_2554400 [Sesamum alatum]